MEEYFRVRAYISEKACGIMLVLLKKKLGQALHGWLL